MSETKICETCKHEGKGCYEYPCGTCRKASGWETNQLGCTFCNGEKVMECGDAEALIIKTKDEGASLWFTDDEKRFREFIFIDYCPICGRKLTKEGDN